MPAPDGGSRVRGAPTDVAGRSRGADWVLTGLLLVAIAVSAASLNSVLGGIAWWWVMVFVAGVLLLASAVVRTFTRGRVWGTLAAIIVGFATLTFMFAPQDALLGLIPTPGTFGQFHELELAGTASISVQDLPADADQGILYLLCLGVAAIAVVMDALAFVARAPALTGLPPLVLLLVPSLVNPTFDDGFFFVLTVVAYIAILLASRSMGSNNKPAGRVAALGLAAVAVAGALIVPLALPPIVADPASGAGGQVTTGLNPIVTLGADLRQGDPTLALSYTSTEPGGLYMRLTALDDFSGVSWSPTSTTVDPSNTVDAIGPAPGLGADVPIADTTTQITVADIASRWLPAPYAPTSVTGLVGEWAWEATALGIRTDSSNARGQVYEVQSTTVQPTIEQLVAAGVVVDAGLERYLDVPADLPPIVASTAAQVVSGATTNYDKAIRLQDYFRSSLFTYSEDAPVDNGYDGSGASVLAAFLQAKAGYCVHFSSAMASMARTLGIPARVAVGFTPGQAVTLDDGTIEYRVTTHNFHAWPELFFSGVGWVRFEPTPGRGSPPEFAPLAVDDPSTPDVDESVPAPVPAPTEAAPDPAAVDPDLADPGAVPESTGTGAAPPAAPWWIPLLAALVALIAVPGIVRALRRMRRLRLTGRGSAADAWDELRDTADDLGTPDDNRTPRQRAALVGDRLDDRSRAALHRLQLAVEGEAYAEQRVAPAAKDVRVVLGGMRRSAGIRRTIIAAVAPRSLVAGWLPAPSRVEPGE